MYENMKKELVMKITTLENESKVTTLENESKITTLENELKVIKSTKSSKYMEKMRKLGRKLL